MISILHISDPHAQGETMRRLNNLAVSHPECDVLALTGDCTSLSAIRLPASWNDWPQRVKLSVPGNHDEPFTFDRLTHWICIAPWSCRVDDLAFVGVDTSDSGSPYSNIELQLNQLDRIELTSSSAIILLTHQWPLENEAEAVERVLQEFVGKRILLVLDGHNHPRSSKWETFGPNWHTSMLSIYRN